jgi:hypothetical protein
MVVHEILVAVSRESVLQPPYTSVQIHQQVEADFKLAMPLYHAAIALAI